MLHESDLKKYQRCDKYYWYTKNKPESVPFLPYVTYNMDIFELVKDYFGFEDVFMGKRGDDPSLTLQAYQSFDILMNARISYRDLRMTLPCLKKEDQHHTLYFLYNQCYPKTSEAQRIADTLWVCKKNQIQVDEVLLIHINANYERKQEFDVHECLLISDEFYNEKNKKAGKVMDFVREAYRDLDALLDEIEQIGDLSHIQKKRSPACTSHYKCEYFSMCFPDQQHNTSILNLVQSNKKYECEAMGISDMAMVTGDEIEATRVQYAQIMAAKKRGLFVDQFALRPWLKRIQYPITYLDFEWQTYVYPPYEKMKPFDVMVFQYSMHIEDKNGELVHEQYIGKNDCREEFVLDLIHKIPKTGSIMVFNAQGAEVLRLMQLSKQFPQYEEELKNIWERMIDLAIPFSNGVIYDERMAGEYNLKKLLSLFSDLSYDELEINQGLLAVKKYRELEGNESEEIKQALYEYCGMDTYAEYVLLHFLMKTVGYE